MTSVDLNCDMGESFGAWTLGADAAVLPFVSSANVACGWHAGDASVMRETVAAARAHGVAIGAHPGLPDLAGFGRRAMAITPQEAYDLVVYQLGALDAFVRASGKGARLAHVKPHGALYNMAAADRALADAIARAVRDVDRALVLFGLAGSALVGAAAGAGLAVAEEVFADRNYLASGALVPRSRADAHVTSVAEAAQRAIRMVRDGRVTSVDGGELAVRADTICIHGDSPHAAELARALRTGLEGAGIAVSAPPAR